MFWAALLDPNAFYVEFSTDSAGWEQFVGDLDKLVFWNPNDTVTASLIALKSVALDRLEACSLLVADRNKAMHEELVDRVRSAIVSHVD